MVSLPQFYANYSGDGLALEWPWTSEQCTFSDGVVGLAGRLMSTLAYVFYSTTLGNVGAEGAAPGLIHLCSEMLLCIMFCIYVYLVNWYNEQVLSTIETADAVRARATHSSANCMPMAG